MHALKRQNGMTAIGWLIVLALIGFFTLVILKVVPSYLEYYKVVSTLESLQEEGGFETPRDIRRLIERRFDISYVTSVSANDVKIRPVGSNYRVIAKYDSKKHLFYNVYVLMPFEKQVLVRGR